MLHSWTRFLQAEDLKAPAESEETPAEKSTAEFLNSTASATPGAAMGSSKFEEVKPQ